MSIKQTKFIVMLLFALFIIGVPAVNVYAASSMNLYDYGTKKNINYTGKQVQYNYNGTTINMKKTPGIIVNGTALASYQETFVNASLKAKAVYSKTKNTVTLTKDKSTIVLTVGSKKAKVNGKTVTMSVAPMKVKYKDQSATKILIPTRFVTENLGYEYIWNSSTSTVNIIPPRFLFYNNKKVAYNGTDGQVTVDGKKVNLGTMPSFILDSTAMVLAKKVFNESSIKADYVYNKSNKTVTLTKGSTVVKLTLGKKTAYVNGKARTMDTAPLVVKNVDTGKSYIMVPGSFVASFLGYDYTWNSSNKTSVITTRPPEADPVPGNGGQDVEEDPELGSDPVPELDSTFLNWEMQSNYSEEYNKIKNLSSSSEITNNSNSAAYVYDISKDSSVVNKEVYAIHSSSPFNNSSIKLQDKILTVHLSNAFTGNSSFNLGGNYVGAINIVNDTTNVTSDINFNVLSTNFKYDFTLSEDKYTLYVTFYPNYITNISVGTKSGNNYLLLNSMEKLQVNITDNGSYLILSIPNTVNAVGDKYADTSSLTYLKSVQCSGAGSNSTSILINKAPDSKFSVSQNGNTYMLSIPEEVEITTGSSFDFKLPSGVNYSAIENEDRYYDHEIALLLPGDYRDFYSNNPITESIQTVSDISVNYSNNQTEILISTTKVQGYRLQDKNGSVKVTIGNPRDIYKNIVVLDAGHGGVDPGAMYSLNGVKYNEKDINYTIMYEKTQKYFNSEDSNVKVYYSRYDDTKVPLTDRAAFASKVGADFFVSLHMNANSKTDINGTDVYYSDLNNEVSDTGLTSKKLASIFLNYLPDQIGTTKRNVALGSNLVVLKYNTVPAVLIELGFMTNKNDLALMTSNDFQEDTAKAIYEAVNLVFEDYPTGR